MDDEQEQMMLDIKNRRRKNRRAKGNENDKRDLIDEQNELKDFMKMHHNLRVKKATDLFRKQLAQFEQDNLVDEFTQRTDALIQKQRMDRLKQQERIKLEMQRRKRNQLNDLKTVDEDKINQKYAELEQKVFKLQFQNWLNHLLQTNTVSNVPVSYQTTVSRQTDEKRDALNELDLEEQSAKERLELEYQEKEEKAEQELKRKQEAERNAREMSKDELDLLHAAHQVQWDRTLDLTCWILSFN